MRPVPRRAVIWLTLSGAAAPLVLAGAILAETVRERGVSAGQQSISLLSEGAQGGLLRLAEVVAGVLTILFAAGLFRAWSRRRGVPRAEAGVGLGLILTGLFIQQHLPPAGVFRVPSPFGYLTAIGLVHIVGAIVLYVSLFLAGMTAARAYPPSRPWGIMRTASALQAIGLVVLLPAFVVAAGLNGPSGWLERGAALVAVIWQEVFAIHLLRCGVPPDPDGLSAVEITI
jgi:hypothetical protein